MMDEFDYIVIGSGSGGGFAARRLSENPANRVLILEAGITDAHWTTRLPAGARYTFDGGPRNWSFETEPEPFMDNRQIFQPRGKVIGGSSSLNGMVYVRGHRQDFAEWGADGVEGWSYDEVLPDYRSIERYSEGTDDYRGGDGPVVVEKLKNNHPIEEAFVQAGAQAGYAMPPDYNGADQEGVSAFDANIDNGYRSGTARACIRPILKRPNVTLLTRAHVTRLILENGRAVGVEYKHAGKAKTVFAAGEIILCAGAFQTPQILMLSGLGRADTLRQHGIDVVADLPGVGENLQDHMECHIKFDCPHKGMTKNHLTAKHRIILAGIEWFLFKTGPAATTHSRMGGFFKSSPEESHPNIQFHFWPYRMEGWSPPPDKDGYCFDVGPTKSPSRGWVRLRSADPFAKPLIQLNALSHDKDMEDFRAAIAIAREIAGQKAFDFCRGRELSPGANATSNADLDAYVRANANSAYHPCGTAKMGAENDPNAVCDSRARVRGIDGLRIADASLMPRITNGNINAPSMMIGERVAGFILEEA